MWHSGMNFKYQSSGLVAPMLINMGEVFNLLYCGVIFYFLFIGCQG